MNVYKSAFINSPVLKNTCWQINIYEKKKPWEISALISQHTHTHISPTMKYVHKFPHIHMDIGKSKLSQLTHCVLEFL